jgi:hypothetical protein
LADATIKNKLKKIIMKKILFLLLFPLWGAGGLFAAVTVTPLSVDYSNKKVTFRVSWTGTPYNNRAWVWVDLCPVTGTSPGTFAQAIISNPSATAGSIETVSGNTRGFYVTTNPSTVTATLSNATGQFNWCAYGSDYPPNAIDNSSGGYALRGSPPFIITTSSGTTEVTATTFSGGTITALTDATGCPGALCGKNGEAAGLLNCCVYGTANCNGACTTTGTYTTNDGACAETCYTAYVQQRNQCGDVINSKYSTYSTTGCSSSCAYTCENCIALCATTDKKYAGLHVTVNPYCFCLKSPNPHEGITCTNVDGHQWANNKFTFRLSYTSDCNFNNSNVTECNY